MPWRTAGEIINDAAVELGLDEPADAYASTDASIKQLTRLLKATGEEMLRRHSWSHLQTQAVLTTSPGLMTYAAPDDFLRIIDQTAWNRTTQFPMAGPVGPQGWQLLKAVDVAGTFTLFFRVIGKRLQIHPTPDAAVDVAYEYVSAYWTRFDGSPLDIPDGEYPVASADEVWLDPHALKCGIKAKWLEAKGFDTTSARQDYELALEMAKSGDGAAPVLSLSGGPLVNDRLLDEENTPDTGFGG